MSETGRVPGGRSSGRLSSTPTSGGLTFGTAFGCSLWGGTRKLLRKRSVELDPLSPNFGQTLAFQSYLTHDYDHALQHSQKTLELDPNFFYSRMVLASAYSEKGMHEEAIREGEEAVRVSGGMPSSKVTLVLAKAGQLDGARKILEKLKRQPKLDNISEYLVAAVHAILGEKDEALERLERAYEQRNLWLFLRGPMFDSLRDDPRFANLCPRIGLPESMSRQPRDLGNSSSHLQLSDDRWRLGRIGPGKSAYRTSTRPRLVAIPLLC